MPAFNFQKQFAPKVKRGEKRQTIRARRKDGRDPKPGDKLHLYTGMRTKFCRKIKTVKCLERELINIDFGGVGQYWVAIDGITLSAEEREEVAKKDGFKSWGKMGEFFFRTHGFPFEGYIYHW